MGHPIRPFIIAPDDPGEHLSEMLPARVTKVFDGDGFLADIFDPSTSKLFKKVHCRLAFIDAPEMQQASGPEAQAFLSSLINGKELQLAPIAKESMNGVPLDPYKRLLCMAYLIDEVLQGQVEYCFNGSCARWHNRSSAQSC